MITALTLPGGAARRACPSLPGTCSQSVPTGISSVIPTRTCTFHLLSRAHSIWSLGLEWTLTKVTPAGWKQKGTILRGRAGGTRYFRTEQSREVWRTRVSDVRWEVLETH